MQADGVYHSTYAFFVSRVRKNLHVVRGNGPFNATCIHKNDHFTKTGSGQTWGRLIYKTGFSAGALDGPDQHGLPEALRVEPR
jgi:hypothetical protein